MILDSGKSPRINVWRPASFLLKLFLVVLLKPLLPCECFALPVDTDWERLSREASRSEFDGDTSKAMLLIDRSLSATKTAPASDRARIVLKKCRMLASQGHLSEAIIEANGITLILSSDRWQDKLVAYHIHRAVAAWCLNNADSAGAVQAARKAVALSRELDSDISVERNKAAIQLVEALIRARMFQEVLAVFQANDVPFQREMYRPEYTFEQVNLLCSVGIAQVALKQNKSGFALLNRSMDMSMRQTEKWVRHHVAQQIFVSGISLDDKTCLSRMSLLINSLDPQDREPLLPLIRRRLVPVS